jgi:hypothetical protein
LVHSLVLAVQARAPSSWRRLEQIRRFVVRSTPRSLTLSPSVLPAGMHPITICSLAVLIYPVAAAAAVVISAAEVERAQQRTPPDVETLGGLTLVPQGPRGAACLDGSAPGYWIGASATSSKGWVIHAQGGG